MGQVRVNAKTEDSQRPEMDELAQEDAADQERITVADIDDVLDDIDTILEENAWVENYLQKGGE